MMHTRAVTEGAHGRAKGCFLYEMEALPRVCQANMALPVSIMLPACQYCRQLLVRAGGDPESRTRVIDHLANIDCPGGEALRRQRAALGRW